MPEWQDVDEIWLIRKSQKGDAEAFGQLYLQYAPRVFRFLFAHLEDRLDAEDLTEEVLFKAWQFLPNYTERGAPFGGFLFRIARNTLLDHLRRSRRNGRGAALDDEWVDGSQPDPAEILVMRMEQNEIRRMMVQLREDYRTVLSLRFLAGLTPEEIAYVMGKSSGAVRVLQHRALAALRRSLARKEKVSDDPGTK